MVSLMNSYLLLSSAMLNDPQIFDSPEVYQPERWLESYNPQAKNLPDIHTVFGFGTRYAWFLPIAVI
jgi:cytochrome P450